MHTTTIFRIHHSLQSQTTAVYTVRKARNRPLHVCYGGHKFYKGITMIFNIAQVPKTKIQMPYSIGIMIGIPHLTQRLMNLAKRK